MQLELALQSVGDDAVNFDLMVEGQVKKTTGGFFPFLEEKSVLKCTEYFFRLPVSSVHPKEVHCSMVNLCLHTLQRAISTTRNANGVQQEQTSAWVDEGQYSPSMTASPLFQAIGRPVTTVDDPPVGLFQGGNVPCPVDLRCWRFLGGKFEQERDIERIQIVLRWLVKEMVKREVTAVESIDSSQHPAVAQLEQMQAATEPGSSAHLLDLAEAEREFLHFLQVVGLLSFVLSCACRSCRPGD
jgi:hypothetical protein